MSYPKPRLFRPRNPNKYIGDVDKIVARSGLETKFMMRFDNDPQIKKWNSEEIVVNYVSPKDGKPHRYFVDFYVETYDGRKFLVEIKPESQTKKPRASGKNAKVIMEKLFTWSINQAKWEAATKFAEKHGMQFRIMTEKDIV